jgi:hypothetical protein
MEVLQSSIVNRQLSINSPPDFTDGIILLLSIAIILLTKLESVVSLKWPRCCIAGRHRIDSAICDALLSIFTGAQSRSSNEAIWIYAALHGSSISRFLLL